MKYEIVAVEGKKFKVFRFKRFDKEFETLELAKAYIRNCEQEDAQADWDEYRFQKS